MTSEEHRALYLLMEAVVNGEASAEQHAQLEEQLLASEVARDAYLDYVNLHAALRQRLLTAVADDLDIANLPVEIARQSFPYPQRKRWRASLLLATGLLGLLAALTVTRPWIQWLNGAQPVATFRVVAGEVTINSAAGNRVAAVGDLLHAGETVRLAGEVSRASFDYADGTQVRMHSDSVVRIPAAGSVRLELLAGSLEVDAAKQRPDHPLVIATQHSRYVVLGTRFRLYHDEQASRLELDEGKVRMVRPARGEVIDIEAGSVAIATSEDTPVEVSPLSLGTAELIQTLRNGGQKVEFSDHRLLVSHGEHGLKTYRRDDYSLMHEYRQHVGGSDAIALPEDGHLVQVNRNGYVLAWKPGEPDAMKLPLPGRHARSRALSPNGQVVAVSAERTTHVSRIDFSNQTLVPLLSLNHSGKAWCLSLSQDGSHLAAGYWDGTVNVYAVPSGEITFSRKLAHTPTHCDLSRDGRSLVIVTQKDGLLLIDIATGEQRSLWPPGANIVRSLRFSQDGRRVLAGLNDRTARMWNAVDGRQVLVVDAGHSPQGIAWSEAEQLLATADGAVKVWKCAWPSSNAQAEIR